MVIDTHVYNKIHKLWFLVVVIYTYWEFVHTAHVICSLDNQETVKRENRR